MLNQSDYPNANPSLTTSAQFDARLYRKIALRIIPFLFVCYVISFLDRINIGFAQLQMKTDLGFSDAMYGIGAAVFYIGYVLFEVPSNLLLEKIGARKTFVRIMLLWGLASVGMMFVVTPNHFYSLRFLLGVFEAGFFPGIVLYLTYWFPPARRAAVLAIFFAGVAVAGVLGGLVSGWIMQSMGGVMGMFGWQWMFLIEGSPALILAGIAYFYLDDKPQDAAWLNDAEKQRIAADLENENTLNIVTPTILSLLSTMRIYMFAFVYFSLTCASLTLSFWMPAMIRDFGVTDVVEISLYSVIPNALAIIGIITISRHSDHKNERVGHFVCCALGGAASLLLLTTHPGNFVLTMGLLSIATTLIFSALPIFWAIPTSYLSKKMAASGVALISSIGITSGIVSPYVIGQIKMATGGMDLAIYLLSGLLAGSCFVLVWVTRRK
ncbi:MFS transporter [Solimicrobium silvestre]|uniref:Major Facilitator Superfamily n=1 Tax=Solimicrobium silvestre TaxID=2099400 RepID=A0A2S9GT46_9BURK|nr:MFS transporter [Solimicrobium silvestre]PRC90894.1 Major Facilitator Superfamily [Solimicrobium silvestre]